MKKYDISSLQNPRIKDVVKLRDDKRLRKRTGLMLVEGVEEINLVLSTGSQPDVIFTAPDFASRTINIPSAEILTVNQAVFEKISYRENPDGWLGVFPLPDRSLSDLRLSSSPLVIVAESLEKPGNLGAIMRTADAAGVDALLVCDPRVDVFNPNVVRASRGTVFTIPIVEVENEIALSWLKERAIQILSASPSAQLSYTEADLRKPSALVVGTEDEGLTDFWLSNADIKVRIPMKGRVNSLNVSVAAGLLIYEAVRQRQAIRPSLGEHQTTL